MFDLAKEMMGTQSMADAVQIQTAFARERFEALVDYSKDVQTRFGALAEKTAKPATTAFQRVVAAGQA